MKVPFSQTFKSRILLAGTVGWVIPLVAILLATGLFAKHLRSDFYRSLEDIKAREGKRLEEHQYDLLNSMMRQKALDVAQEIILYLDNHPSQPLEKVLRDPEFRELAVQPVGLIGETFLLAPDRKRILLHSQPSFEGQELAKMIPCRHLAQALEDYREKDYLSGRLCVCLGEPGEGQPSHCEAFFVTVAVLPRGGPNLVVVACAYLREVDNVVALNRAILKTAMNLSRALLDTRLRRFQYDVFLLLGSLGFLAFLASLGLARSLTQEVAALTQATEAYNAGDLDYRIGQPSKDELGQLAHTLNHMAASLKENTVSRSEWENTFNIVPDQIMVLDAEQRVARLNRAAADYLGVSPEEAVGCLCYELMHPSRPPSPLCTFLRMLQEGSSAQWEFKDEERGHTFLVTADPLRDRDGKISGGVHVARDITTLKQAQQELAQTSHFLQQLIEAAPLAVAVVNRQGLFTHVNPQVFTEYGYTPEEILEQHYSMMYADAAEMQQVVQELRERGEVLSRRVHLRHKDGRVVPSRLSIRYLWGAEGELLGSVALSRNISEEVSLQRQLEQMQKLEAVATLAGGLAHNFNNLLMVILGLASLMLSKIDPGHPFHADLKEIEKQVHAGRELTLKLLTFARGVPSVTQPLDLNKLVRTTADVFARTHRDITVHLKLAPDLPPVDADPSQMQQVLMNLLINAWQAMPEGGEIILTTRTLNLSQGLEALWEVRPGPVVELTVADTGEGMDQETLSHLFEPFFTTKAPGEGTGLGLASTYRIIKSHGGIIQVKSARGQGSTFNILLPVSPSPPEVLPREETRIVRGEGTILVVDDEPVLRRVAARLLEKLGYRVLEAPGGQEALEIFQARGGAIDLVLLDLIMPDLSGYQTLERLRALNPGVRVLLCSGYGDREGETLPPGISTLAKPYTLELLSQKVAEALKG